MASWLSWLERRPVTAEVEGSTPFEVAKDLNGNIIFKLSKHTDASKRRY